MSRPVRKRATTLDSAAHHREWLSLVEISGPFLSLPVLRATWPSLDPLDKTEREQLRVRHAEWQADPAAGQSDWIRYVLTELLEWGDTLHETDLDPFPVQITEHDTQLTPSFALVTPGEKVTPESTRLLGLVCPPEQHPTGRIPDSTWAATPVDRLAHLCRHHRVELGLVTNGRFWVLVWAPRGKATATAVFDAVDWPEAAERTVVRAFRSLLSRRRFFGVPPQQRLERLFADSTDNQEEITEALGVQVRRAVELLVAALGRADRVAQAQGYPGLRDKSAHEVYRGAVAVMMRIVFLLFAEERKLLPADNDLYAQAYSASRLCAELEQQASDGTEEQLEHSFTAWHRLLALFTAVHSGIDHPRLRIHAHDGSLFNPNQYDWLDPQQDGKLLLQVDDRTVLHMLRAVQYVEVGTGRSRERRRVSFRSLDVEQIGYVYEGLLAFEGFRADEVTVGLIGKEGLEEEVPLRELEALAAQATDLPGLANALAQTYKDSKIGSAAALAKKLAPLSEAEWAEARKRLLAVTGNDHALTERLRPFVGIIRQDLRGLPMVILPGQLFVTESTLRKNTGTHYTPRALAEQVVEGALEPLVYEPGPLQTADRDQWRLKSSDQILALKVADIAMGSGAFLVAAARYLGDRLVEAWVREGDPRAAGYRAPGDDRPLDADQDPVVVEARRQVITHCLYGVDINPMAVEMAKLSLWLVSMDPQRPFTFLDDRLAVGDSLLGIGNLAALPKEAARDLRIERELAQARELRRQIAALPTTQAGLAEKQRLLAEAHQVVHRSQGYADLVAGGWLAATLPGREKATAVAERIAELTRKIADGADPSILEEQAQAWLRLDLPTNAFDRKPLHWPLTFPEVFDQGGFDAIIGNPPFLGGQKLTGSLGTAYREYLVRHLGKGARGSADLVAYFVLRAHELLNPTGQTGLIATNTLAQGDTREVGLDQLVAAGVTIRQAIKSEKWPSKSAALEYCAIWTSRAPLGEQAVCVVDGRPVTRISPSLEPASRIAGNPYRLAANAGISFQGSNILGLGFTMEPDRAKELIEKDERNREVLFPYLNGQDVNSRPDCSASRWVINFHDWDEARAKTYPECYDQVRRLVKPERDKNNRKVYRDYWWHYAEKRPAMVKAIAGLERVMVITLVSKTVMPVMVPTGQVFAHKLGVFATDDLAMLALLSSSPHFWWTLSKSSTMKSDINYSLSDAFENFPLPELTGELRELGERLDTYRREVMLSRQAGLTATYNLVFDPACQDEDIVELRRIHQAIDEATCRAYGWNDLLAQGLDHGFHRAGAYIRYTVGPVVQREITDRLLELNHQRYAEEVAAGLHDGKQQQVPSTLF